MKDVQCPNCKKYIVITNELQDLLYETNSIVGVACETCNVVLSVDYIKENMQ